MKPAKTFVQKPASVERDWYIIDAADFALGRLATVASGLLVGKHKPSYTPHVDGGDWVVVINADQIRLSGNKEQAKTYYRHSGYVGNLKARSAAEQRQRAPERLVQMAVFGMLPKNKLRRLRQRRLKVYAGADHPHDGQQPQKLNQPAKTTTPKQPAKETK